MDIKDIKNGLSYNKEEVIAAIDQEFTISGERREKLKKIVRQADCEIFQYGSGVISEMEIKLSPNKREGSPRRSVCGHVVFKILKELGVENPPEFSSVISIEGEQELYHLKKI